MALVGRARRLLRALQRIPTETAAPSAVRISLYVVHLIREGLLSRASISRRSVPSSRLSVTRTCRPWQQMWLDSSAVET